MRRCCTAVVVDPLCCQKHSQPASAPCSSMQHTSVSSKFSCVKVYPYCLASWSCCCTVHRGIPAAVKVMQLPAFQDEPPAGAPGPRSPVGGAGLAAAAVAERRRRGGINRREQMAVMEAALGASLSHPNILQVRENSRAEEGAGRAKAHRWARAEAHCCSILRRQVSP